MITDGCVPSCCAARLGYSCVTPFCVGRHENNHGCSGVTTKPSRLPRNFVTLLVCSCLVVLRPLQCLNFSVEIHNQHGACVCSMSFIGENVRPCEILKTKRTPNSKKHARLLSFRRRIVGIRSQHKIDSSFFVFASRKSPVALGAPPHLHRFRCRCRPTPRCPRPPTPYPIPIKPIP